MEQSPLWSQGFRSCARQRHEAILNGLLAASSESFYILRPASAEARSLVQREVCKGANATVLSRLLLHPSKGRDAGLKWVAR